MGSCMGSTKCPLCWVGEHPSSPGNPRKSLDMVAEDLAENDAVSDTLWDLRGTILHALKERRYILPETTGPEVQSNIDDLIRKLVFLV